MFVVKSIHLPTHYVVFVLVKCECILVFCILLVYCIWLGRIHLVVFSDLSYKQDCLVYHYLSALRPLPRRGRFTRCPTLGPGFLSFDLVGNFYDIHKTKIQFY